MLVKTPLLFNPKVLIARHTLKVATRRQICNIYSQIFNGALKFTSYIHTHYLYSLYIYYHPHFTDGKIESKR